VLRVVGQFSGSQEVSVERLALERPQGNRTRCDGPTGKGGRGRIRGRQVRAIKVTAAQ